MVDTLVLRQPFVLPLDLSIHIQGKLTHGISMGDWPVGSSDRSRNIAQTCRQDAFVVSISSIVHQRPAAWTSHSRGSHPAVDGSYGTVRHAKRTSTEERR
jgi:hypothetical protein